MKMYNSLLGWVEINEVSNDRDTNKKEIEITLEDVLWDKKVKRLSKLVNSEVRNLIDVKYNVCVDIIGLEISDGYISHGVVGRGLTYYLACEDFVKKIYRRKINEYLKCNDVKYY
jgi:hypothetical protein